MRRRVTRSEQKDRLSRARDDRGAVLVEAAFMLPFLIALLMGIIDFGFVFNDWISVRQGGRDGLREVIVNTSPSAPGGGTWSCDNPGNLSGDALALACYTKDRVGLDGTKTRVKVAFTANNFVAGQPVKICVMYQTGSVTGAYAGLLNTKVLSTEVESLIEQPSVPSTTFTSGFAEPLWTGVSWPSTCDNL